MKIKFLSLALIPLALSAIPPMPTSGAVVAHDKAYYTHKLSDSDVELIYTKDNIKFAQDSADIEKLMHTEYEKMFDWKLDETLYVGLISDHNQIANGFSTQWPNNRQINYVGGSEKVDYFTSTSWLHTLLYHETAHNYQINVKESVVSESLHAIFGNGLLFLPFPLPLILPNSVINPFMLEGNAVLNESWHGNGGRLYNGRLKAQTLLQAKSDNLKPEYLYNSKLAFPYGEIVYIQGGFYNYYLAQNYGLEETNSFFKNNSKNIFWPFFTN